MNRCSFPDCIKPRRTQKPGLCETHRTHVKRYGAPRPIRYPQTDPCRIVDCLLPHEARGVCKKHYRIVGQYGMTPETYNALLESQGGGCAVCGVKECASGNEWAIDHDHSCCPDRKNCCGKCNRGLLCMTCNVGIGNLQDSPDLMRKAAEYVEGFNTEASNQGSP